MSEVIKVYVGTDPQMRKAEIALEYSIRAHTNSKVDITWMDYSRKGNWSDWDIGHEHGKPYSHVGWSTDFTCFRFAIPEANGFQGRAIYLDADMILLRDIKELFDFPMANAVSITPVGFDVMLYDCEEFEDADWWPSIDEMKKNGWGIDEYVDLLKGHDMIGPLAPKWNCLDGNGYKEGFTGLLHFTDMHTQPWKPYPETFAYLPHPRPDMVALWQKYYEEGLKMQG